MINQYVIIVGGGKGLRMGADLPKQFIPLEGKPILMHTLERFHQWNKSAKLIVVLPEEHQPYWNMLCRELSCTIPHLIANGGETRFHSVRNGLRLVNDKAYVAVHDGVRPFVNTEVIAKCFDKVTYHAAVIPVIPMTDSLRKKEASGETHPVNRDCYFSVQTPQVFESELLQEAYRQKYSPLFTDDASVVESLNKVDIHTVQGNQENIKITTPFDLLIAKAFIRTL